MRRTVSGLALLIAALALIVLPASAYAQHRGGGGHPGGPGGGHAGPAPGGHAGPIHGGGRGAVIVGGAYYYGYGPYWWDPLWYPYPYPYYGYGYPYGYPPYPYGAAYVDDASIRVEVKPREAQVYVDGYYAGLVDDFDGMFQRLHVEPGDHEIVLWLDGYKTVRQHLSVARNSSYKVKYEMEKLAAGEAQEPKPVPPPPPPGGYQQQQQPWPQMPPRGPEYQPREMPPSPQYPAPNAAPSRASGYGVIAIRVQPADAEVLIDGESWQGPQGEERLLVQVSEGSHHVEIRKSGRRTFATDIVVHGGETVPLNVSLSQGGQQ